MRFNQEEINSISTYLTMESVDGAPPLEGDLLFLGKIDRHDARVSLAPIHKLDRGGGEIRNLSSERERFNTHDSQV